tara:strand:+ start:110 stop:511 length:402 start_codon:yes stop_codon:yes gene_type:complete
MRVRPTGITAPAAAAAVMTRIVPMHTILIAQVSEEAHVKPRAVVPTVQRLWKPLDIQTGQALVKCNTKGGHAKLPIVVLTWAMAARCVIIAHVSLLRTVLVGLIRQHYQIHVVERVLERISNVLIMLYQLLKL